jgi:hypothetical protein
MATDRRSQSVTVSYSDRAAAIYGRRSRPALDKPGTLTMNIMEWLRALIVGVICGAIFVTLSHMLSRPVNDGEVIGAAVAAAIIMVFVKRHQAGD